MQPNQLPQPPQPPEEMTGDEELTPEERELLMKEVESIRREMDRMYLANRYLRTPRSHGKKPLPTKK
jgi:hypothetical protein